MIDPLRPTRRKRLYTIGPIRANPASGTQAENVERARGIAIELRKVGWSVFCPHLNSVDIPGFGLDDYLGEDFEWLAVSDAGILLPYWSCSAGSLREIDFAALHGIPLWDWRALLPDGRA